MKFLVESEFQGQEPPRTQETTKTTSTIRIPRVGFGTDRPYIALFLRPTFPDTPVVPFWGHPECELPNLDVRSIDLTWKLVAEGAHKIDFILL